MKAEEIMKKALEETLLGFCNDMSAKFDISLSELNGQAIEYLVQNKYFRAPAQGAGPCNGARCQGKTKKGQPCAFKQKSFGYCGKHVEQYNREQMCLGHYLNKGAKK
jgi:hypothetical protein